MNDLVLKDASLAHVSVGRWCAKCSNPWCDEAVEFESIKPPVFPKFMPGFQCWACGHKTAVVWPSAEMVHGVERMLLFRRNPNNQNWFPGETLNDLHEENMLNGVYGFVGEIDAPTNRVLMRVHDTEMRDDLLPEINPRRELRAVER